MGLIIRIPSYRKEIVSDRIFEYDIWDPVLS